MRFHHILLGLFVLSVASMAHADVEVFDLTIKDHKFTPDTLNVPVGKKVKLKVFNADATPEEFESNSLDREKVVPGNSRVTIFIGPLEAGEYEFFGEFNPDTAQGKIVAK